MKTILKTSVGALALMSAGLGSAAEEASVESRMEAYENKIKTLEERLDALTPKGVKKQAKDIKRNKKQLAKLRKKLSDEEERFRLNGFITAAASLADEPLGGGYFLDDKVNFRGDSKVGVQFNYQVDEKIDTTIQLVARSRNEDSWNVDAEWAFVGYEFTDNVKGRIGRLRIPFYLYSESIDVGFSYPWVRPPIEMYTTVITAFDGADLVFKANTGPIGHRIQVWGAGYTNTDSTSSQNIDINDTYGINITSFWGDFTARLNATQLKISGRATQSFYYDQFTAAFPAIEAATGGTVTCDDGASFIDPLSTLEKCGSWQVEAPVSDTFDYYSAALKYDNGNLLLLTEGAVLKVKNGFFTDTVSGYVTGAYRFGEYTPFITHGWTYSINEEDFTTQVPASVISEKMKSWNLGVRYSLSESSSLKVEWNHFTEFEGTGNFGGEALSEGQTDLDSADVFTVAIDAVF